MGAPAAEAASEARPPSTRRTGFLGNRPWSSVTVPRTGSASVCTTAGSAIWPLPSGAAKAALDHAAARGAGPTARTLLRHLDPRQLSGRPGWVPHGRTSCSASSATPRARAARAALGQANQWRASQAPVSSRRSREETVRRGHGKEAFEHAPRAAGLAQQAGDNPFLHIPQWPRAGVWAEPRPPHRPGTIPGSPGRGRTASWPTIPGPRVGTVPTAARGRSGGRWRRGSGGTGPGRRSRTPTGCRTGQGRRSGPGSPLARCLQRRRASGGQGGARPRG